MREAIYQYVDREEKREAFRQDALQAWEAFRATGQHVTADQADAWLAQLEQGGMSPEALAQIMAQMQGNGQAMRDQIETRKEELMAEMGAMA